jgi:hypothetical protein
MFTDNMQIHEKGRWHHRIKMSMQWRSMDGGKTFTSIGNPSTGQILRRIYGGNPKNKRATNGIQAE